MKIYFFAVLFALAGNHVKAVTNDTSIEFKGFGVKSVLPHGFTLSRVGTFLTHSTGTGVVLLTAAPTNKYNAENDKEYLKYSFPVPPEPFQNKKLTGRFYTRDRSNHGAEWDGTWLSVNRKNLQLSVIVEYRGPGGKFREFSRHARPFMDNLEWDESKLDSEIAFGARLNIPGLLPVKGQVGVLVYNRTGRPEFRTPHITISSTPLTQGLPAADFSRLCELSLTRTFAGRKYQGPYINGKNGVQVCDGWGSDQRGSTMYVAVTALPTGNVINALGYIPETMKELSAQRLRESILNIQLLR